MPANKDGELRFPTPLMERWRGECQRALAQSNPDGSDDHLVALIVGSYFDAMHWGLGGVTDPQAQERLCEQEAARFLAMLRGVPTQRRQLLEDKAEKQRGAGLLVFPALPDEGDPS